MQGDMLAPNSDMERVRDVWARTFGAGKRALMLNRGESLAALNEAREGRRGRAPAGKVKGASKRVVPT